MRRALTGVAPAMADGHTITIRPSTSHVEVRLGGQLLAASDRAVELDETGLPTRYYLPKDDVRMDLLTANTSHTFCRYKGDASYWSATVDGTAHHDIVWAYEAPIPESAGITGLLSFYPSRAEVTVDGRPLTV